MVQFPKNCGASPVFLFERVFVNVEVVIVMVNVVPAVVVNYFLLLTYLCPSVHFLRVFFVFIGLLHIMYVYILFIF